MAAPVGDKSLGALIAELRQMVVGYVREQATTPLRGAFRFLRLGVIGGLVACVAGVLVGTGALRAAQTITLLDIDRGGWSWLVYLVIGLVLIVVGAVFVMTGARSRRRA